MNEYIALNTFHFFHIASFMVSMIGNLQARGTALPLSIDSTEWQTPMIHRLSS